MNQLHETLILAESLIGRARWQMPTTDPLKFDAERTETLRGTLALLKRSFELVDEVLDKLKAREEGWKLDEVRQDGADPPEYDVEAALEEREAHDAARERMT